MYCSLFVVSSVSSYPLLLCKTSPCIVGLAGRRGLSDVPLRSQCMDDDSNCFHFSHVSTNHMRLTRPALLPCRVSFQSWCMQHPLTNGSSGGHSLGARSARSLSGAVTWQGGRGRVFKEASPPPLNLHAHDKSEPAEHRARVSLPQVRILAKTSEQTFPRKGSSEGFRSSSHAKRVKLTFTLFSQPSVARYDPSLRPKCSNALLFQRIERAR